MGFTCTDGELRYTEWWDNAAQKVLGKELYLCDQDYMQQALNLEKDLNYGKEVLRMAKLLEMQFPQNRRSSYPQKDN